MKKRIKKFLIEEELKDLYSQFFKKGLRKYKKNEKRRKKSAFVLLAKEKKIITIKFMF